MLNTKLVSLASVKHKICHYNMDNRALLNLAYVFFSFNNVLLIDWSV